MEEKGYGRRGERKRKEGPVLPVPLQNLTRALSRAVEYNFILPCLLAINRCQPLRCEIVSMEQNKSNPFFFEGVSC